MSGRVAEPGALASRKVTVTIEGHAMNIRRSKQSVFPAIAAIALIAVGISVPAFAEGDLRHAPREGAVSPSRGAPSVLAQIRTECPLLGNIIEEFALQDLGEVPRKSIDLRSGEIAMAAGFAVAGDIAAMQRHAKSALDAGGATKLEFKALLYLTAVNAGAEKAIEATRALSDLLSRPDGAPVSLCVSGGSAARPPQG
jgi:alkylhydroperoxidase/carboxymuconolactone decarboxylase family protein YurZ